MTFVPTICLSVCLDSIRHDTTCHATNSTWHATPRAYDHDQTRRSEQASATHQSYVVTSNKVYIIKSTFKLVKVFVYFQYTTNLS